MRSVRHQRFLEMKFRQLTRRFFTLRLRTRVGSIAIIILSIVGYAGLYRAPATFPSQTIVHIPEGMTLYDISLTLKEQHVIQSPGLLRVLTTLLGGEHSIQSGDYLFGRHPGVGKIALMLSRGEFGIEAVRITIPEGATAREIGEILGRRLPAFDKETFIQIAKEKEGYLFPDTYFLSPRITPLDAVVAMEKQFQKQVTPLLEEVSAFGKTLDEVVTMASLLEKEARTKESRQTIAGILWRRISLGMPLQVDAVFGYIHDTNTFHPTYDDLDVDSPYNTYRNKGLPPGPIANPGLSAIRAAIEPIKTNYLFYLSDRSGTIYYSATFEEHVAKKHLFLN